MKSKLPFYTWLLLTGLMVGCKKDKDQPVTSPKKAFLEIAMQQYINGAAIDSGYVESEINGTTDTTHLTIKNDSLFCPVDSLPAGNIKLSVTLYQKARLAGRRILWLLELPAVTVDKKKSLTYKGPAAFKDLAWKPRLFIPDPVLDLTFIAGILPSDPYFVIKHIAPKWVDISVHKDIWNTSGIIHIGTKSFACFNNCPLTNGNLENNTAWAGLPEIIGTRPWNYVEINAQFGDGNVRNGWWVLGWNYTIPDGD